MTTVAFGQAHSSVLETGRRVTAYADQLFTHLPRADQRRWAAAYLLGLLAVSGRKSVRSLAAAVTDSPTASQSLHRFVNSSPWPWQPARRELTRWVEQQLRPTAWTVGTAVVPKRGNQSCGVHRRFVPALGRTINCQVGIGLFLASGHRQVPVDWRLHLPGEWADERLRRRARVPEQVRPLPVWAQVLDLADALATRTSAPLPLVANLCEYKESDRLLQGLRQRGHDFIVTIPGTLPVLPTAPLPGRGGDSSAPVVSAQSFLDASGEVPRSVVMSTHSGSTRLTRIVTGLVRLPRGAHAPRFYRLFAEYPREGQGAPVIRLTSLAHRPMDELLQLAQVQAGTPGALRHLEGSFGLQDFEGRSYPGWHRHVTLVSAACAYSRLVEAEPGDHVNTVPPEWLHADSPGRADLLV
ncbi:IS701 family transposase [Streptomyces violascens]|uniref:ISXo8 transposase n=1 Tax=Streptomyces violascens TaxID=67381 RepID=A0ABQ3QSX0_9ACTN|nr:transposase [Streptomyces violascens]GGU51904.1 putative ISXo8 transposase [Streptomyces violascens]GHI40335.1 putative ISXo8 transposase [Streptomyces violascens]